MGLGASGTTTWTDYGVTAGQTYSCRVRAWNADGYSGYSNTAAATVGVAGGGTTLPAAPLDLVGSTQGKNQVRLAWKNGAGVQDAVKIGRCRGSACSDFAQVAAVSGTATSYADSGLSRNTDYRYRVRSHNSVGDSAYSNVATVRTSSK